MKALVIGSFFAALALFGAGCVDLPFETPAPHMPAQNAQNWVLIDRGFERLTYRFSSSTESIMTVYRIDPALYQFRFSNAGAPRRMQDWLALEPAASLVANGVYFHEDDQPSGLMMIDGKRVGTRQFDLDKSGAIIFSDDVRLVDTKTESVEFATLTNAAQSYPFLVKDGAIAVAQDSGLKARRTFFGTDREGFVYVGVVSYDELSLAELAKQLAGLSIPWRHVLNLDGGPSTGLITRFASEPSYETITGVPNAVLVERKAQ